ncbi:MAG: serine/threonine protein kinase, partial [Leifsonia sp.]
GRADVPSSLEALLRRAMSRRPELRPGSVLEVVRELQLIEPELGVPQTAIEVAMDDWALGTVADLEERTRVRPSASAVKAPVRRRRRAAANGEYSPVGTVREVSGPGPRSNSRATRPAPVPRAVTWIIVLASALVLALGITALVVLVRAGANGSGIPVVTDISATRSGSTVRFTWQNPGLTASDRYQIQVIGGTSSIQLSPRFVVDATPGETVCITVAVNRDGKTGDPSAEKCVDVTDG